MAKSWKEVNDRLNKTLKVFEQKRNMKSLGNEMRDIIKTRTRTSGKDVNDEKFDDLHTKTIARKRKTNKPLPSKSRLTDTSKMLDDMSTAATTGRAVVFFADDEMRKRAEYNQEGTSNPNRVFFGISRKDQKKMEQFIRELFRKIARTEK